MKKTFLQIISLAAIVSSLFFLNSCENCDDYACFTPPQSYRLILMDSANGSDLLYNGTIEKRFVTILDNQDKLIETSYMVDSIQERTYLHSTAFWNTDAENSNFRIRIQTDTAYLNIPFVVFQLEHHEDCCTFFTLEKFEIYDYHSQIISFDFCEVYIEKPF